MVSIQQVLSHKTMKSLLSMMATSLLSMNIQAGSINDYHRVENLNYGQALFEYFQQHELKAITDLLVAEQRLQSGKQRDESDLLLADLYYTYGLYAESDRLFSRLLSADTDRGLLNRIRFNLARLNHEQGKYDGALELLSQIDDSLPKGLQNEKLYFLTNLYLRHFKYSDAAKAQQAIDRKSIWYQYARYNLGIGLIESKRPDEGQSYLGPLGQLETNSEELLALRDRANLSLGLSQLRQSQPEAALISLERIRLEGPFSHTALLATGMAWNQQGQFGKALVPWLELARKNTIDPASQEALLAIPGSLEENQKPKLAIQYYELAANQFDQQLEVLDQSIASIQSGELVKLLNRNALVYQGAEFTAASLHSSSAPYLHLLMATSEFQRELKRYRDLIDISSTLNHWYFNLPTLALMLKERRQRFQEKLPLLEQTGNFDHLEALKNSRRVLVQQLDQIELGNDYLGLASIEENGQLQRLDKVSKTLISIGEQRDTSNEQDMHRLLNGLLLWQIDTSYAARLWAAKKQLNDLDKALQTTTSRADSLRRITANSLQKFDNFEFRIQIHTDKINRLIERVFNLIKRQENRIVELSISAIDAQKNHIDQLRLNARYALARLYDTVASE